MTEGVAGLDGPAADVLLRAGWFFTRWDETDDGRAVFREGGRKGDVFTAIGGATTRSCARRME